MDRIKNHISHNNININKLNDNKTLKINPIYFSIELIPYNKILNNIMVFLQKKLSPKIFNNIYKYFIKEIKKYITTSSYKKLKSNDMNANKNISLEKKKPIKIMDFYLNKNDVEQRNKQLKIKNTLNKKIKPMVGLSYINKIDNLKSKKNISISSFSNLNFNYLDIKKIYNNYKNNTFTNNNNSLNKTTNYNSNSDEKKFNKKRKKITLNNNKFVMNEKLPFNQIMLNNNHYNTINTSIHKKNNLKLNKISFMKKIDKGNNSQHLSNNVRKKISNTRTLKNIPHQTFTDIVNKKSNINKFKSNTNSNIKNSISINNEIFNKNNKGIFGDNKRKLKIINIKLQKPKNNGGEGVKKSLQTSEEMLKHIKNSLDDENLKGMLNFSYENFLSKESERESKEYSIED